MIVRSNVKLLLISVAVVLAGCQPTGTNLEASVYQVGQANQKQEARVVNILTVLPARIEISNEMTRTPAQPIGGLAGAIEGGGIGNNTARHSSANVLIGGATGGAPGALAGSGVSDKTLVEGVSLTYAENGKTLSSAQVGKICEFQPGMAIVISSGPNEARLLPNNTCLLVTHDAKIPTNYLPS
jgi:outer membrane lipoprotein SlyB